jgi:hypothetical protein
MPPAQYTAAIRVPATGRVRPLKKTISLRISAARRVTGKCPTGHQQCDEQCRNHDG